MLFRSVNIDETNIFFDMEGELTLVEKEDKTMALKTKGTLMQSTALLGGGGGVQVMGKADSIVEF